MTGPADDDGQRWHLDRERRMLRAALALALIALGVAVGALCHVLRVLGC